MILHIDDNKHNLDVNQHMHQAKCIMIEAFLCLIQRKRHKSHFRVLN